MPVCELCGKSDFVKQDGVFVCQGCGTKYTLEEARKLSGSAPEGQGAQSASAQASATQVPGAQASVSAADVVQSVAAVALGALLEALKTSDDFKPAAAAGESDARSINNYICQGWQMVLEGYKKFEHPSKPQLDNVVTKAKESLVALDNAAMLEPEKYVQNTLIYSNCAAIEESVLDLPCYELKDGSWKKMFSPLNRSDVKISGQKENWTQKRDAHRTAIEDEYRGMHESEVAQMAELQAQAAGIRAELDDLKAEKKSKGFFNFAEKGEVKQRMAPVKQRLSDVEGQIRALERLVDDYVEARIDELGKTFTRLKF